MEKTKQAAKSNDLVEAARRYVDQQLATMKKYGSAPTLSQKAYNALVQKVVAVSR
jgi:hypothetical protein